MDKINERIAKLEEELSALKAELDKPKPFKRQKPKAGQGYFSVTYGGRIGHNNWSNSSYDRFRWRSGNIFLRPDDAKRYLDILNRAHELIGDWEPDWSDADQDKWFLVYDNNAGRFCADSACKIQEQQGFCFKAREDIVTLIKEFGYDLHLIMGRA